MCNAEVLLDMLSLSFSYIVVFTTEGCDSKKQLITTWVQRL